MTVADVELANREGRLHPSQRGKLLDGTFWTAAVLVLAGLVLTSLAIADGVAAATVPILLVTAWFAFVCGRRLAEAGSGRLVVVTGWTHDFGKVHGKRPEPGQYPIYLYTVMDRMWFTYLVVEGRSFRLDDRELRARIQAERTNAVYLTPRTKLLVNVLPA
ncbi:hypothetical protein M8542_10620 [Amycolatopsis sp. OK19-0408]|uniref:Uncharacterized protein n=1 Tax=Amycolatopsis iheyensis TaxID=2945988 RepID=A0A9X2N795_9PSEU|nr:hypothetical protein [Amycolatopsis iheyensis]MCR6483269.1 hypothetical protein [Amycolatopsis iheyensis]